VRTNVGVQDLSSMGEVDIKGPGAERLINRLLVNEIQDLEPGQVRYSTMCNEDGGIVDDLTVYKFSDEHFMIVTSSAPRKRAVRWIVENAAGASAYPTDITASVALLAVQGPRSRDLLRELVEGVDLDTLRFFRFQAGTIGEVEVLCSRSGYTGELGYELYVPAEEVGPVWDTLLARGREFGMQPYGALAMQSLRIEKALPLYGRDITEELTPFNVGLDRWIRFDKREFIGRDGLLRVQEEGIRERFVGLVLDLLPCAPLERREGREHDRCGLAGAHDGPRALHEPVDEEHGAHAQVLRDERPAVLVGDDSAAIGMCQQQTVELGQ
jgi:aminomethyltransferase